MPDDASIAAKGRAGEIIGLWPDGPPSVLPPTPPESSFEAPAGSALFSMLRNVSEPTLTVYAPDPAKANGVGVIVVPGGGWRILAWEHEGVQVAEWLADHGYAAFLLRYRVTATPEDPAEFWTLAAETARLHAEAPPHAKAPNSITELFPNDLFHHALDVAADDGRRAVAIVRERAAEFGVDPSRIGMIGFSAGAFLTVDVALEPGGPPLAFIAPIYGGETRGKPVPPDAPPMFVAITHDDGLLINIVENLYLDWSNANRSAELHVFRRGSHGFGMVKQGLPSDGWINLFESWLKDLGFG